MEGKDMILSERWLPLYHWRKKLPREPRSQNRQLPAFQTPAGHQRLHHSSDTAASIHILGVEVKCSSNKLDVLLTRKPEYAVFQDGSRHVLLQSGRVSPQPRPKYREVNNWQSAVCKMACSERIHMVSLVGRGSDVTRLFSSVAHEIPDRSHFNRSFPSYFIRVASALTQSNPCH